MHFYFITPSVYPVSFRISDVLKQVLCSIRNTIIFIYIGACFLAFSLKSQNVKKYYFTYFLYFFLRSSLKIRDKFYLSCGFRFFLASVLCSYLTSLFIVFSVVVFLTFFFRSTPVINLFLPFFACFL